MLTKLTDMADIQYGYAFDSGKFSEDETCIPIVRIRDVKRGYSETFYEGDYLEEYVLHKGDLLVGMDGEFNIARWNSRDALLNQRVCKITAKKGTDEEYLRFALSVTLKFIENKTSFATVKHLSAKELNRITLNAPEYEEQNKIATILGKVECLIALYTKEIQHLDILIKARFVEMFGDVVINDKGWSNYRFSDIASSRLGKMLDAKQQTGLHKYPYLANFNVQWMSFNLENLNQMDFDENDQHEFALEDGDLLICEGGEIGRCAIWHKQIEPCFFQKALHRVRCNPDIVIPEYLTWWFRYNSEHGGFEKIAGAKATIAHLPGVKLKALQVVVPPLDLQNQFAAFVSEIDKSKFYRKIHAA